MDKEKTFKNEYPVTLNEYDQLASQDYTYEEDTENPHLTYVFSNGEHVATYDSDDQTMFSDLDKESLLAGGGGTGGDGEHTNMIDDGAVMQLADQLYGDFSEVIGKYVSEPLKMSEMMESDVHMFCSRIAIELVMDFPVKLDGSETEKTEEEPEEPVKEDAAEMTTVHAEDIEQNIFNDPSMAHNRSAEAEPMKSGEYAKTWKYLGKTISIGAGKFKGHSGAVWQVKGKQLYVAFDNGSSGVVDTSDRISIKESLVGKMVYLREAPVNGPRIGMVRIHEKNDNIEAVSLMPGMKGRKLSAKLSEMGLLGPYNGIMAKAQDKVMLKCELLNRNKEVLVPAEAVGFITEVYGNGCAVNFKELKKTAMVEFDSLYQILL
jgi:hypothetical protein